MNRIGIDVGGTNMSAVLDGCHMTAGATSEDPEGVARLRVEVEGELDAG